jgi:ankyrin repeat protein
LLLAFQNKYAKVAQLLCRARADIEKRFVGNTVLFWASCLGYAHVTDRATPLRIASQHGHADVAQFLCAATADINTLVFVQ